MVSFDTVDHGWLIRFLQHRIADNRVVRLITKWLRAGLVEDGKHASTTVGTPQGSVISPLLANIYLHYVFDLWLHAWRRRNARGNIRVVRYADDIVIGCEKHDDAHRLKAALFGRFARFSLTLHPEKTQLIEFGRFACEHAPRSGRSKPATFAFLGFTHVCSYQRTNGQFKLLRISRRDRSRKKLGEIKEWLTTHRHSSVPQQGRYLRSVLQGWLNYHAVPGNGAAIRRFSHAVAVLWFRSLRRRSHKARRLNWTRMTRYLARWFPQLRILHPYPEQRFFVKHPRQEPYALAAHVRICAGGAG